MLKHRVREWTSIHRSLELAYAAGFRSRLVEIVDAWSKSGRLDPDDATWLSDRSPRLRFDVRSIDGSAMVREDLGHAYRTLPFSDLSAWIQDPDACFADHTSDPARGERLVVALERVATLRFLEILQTLTELGLEPDAQRARLRRCSSRHVLAFDVSLEGNENPPFSSAPPLTESSIKRLRRNLKSKRKRRPIEDSGTLAAGSRPVENVATPTPQAPVPSPASASSSKDSTSTPRARRVRPAAIKRRKKATKRTTRKKRVEARGRRPVPARRVTTAATVCTAIRRRVRRKPRRLVIARRTKRPSFGRLTRIRRSMRRGPVPVVVAELAAPPIASARRPSVIRRNTRRNDRRTNDDTRKAAIQWTRRARPVSASR